MGNIKSTGVNHMSMDYELHDKLDMYYQMYLDCGYDMQSARKEAASRVLQEVWQQIKSWRDKQEELYCIVNKDDNSEYWSNEYGWTGVDEATIFTKEQTERLNLPIDGRWLQIHEGNEEIYKALYGNNINKNKPKISIKHLHKPL